MWMDLGNPYPLPEPARYSPLDWGEGDELRFGVDATTTDEGEAGYASLASLIGSRRTRYGFSSISLETLGNLFTLTSRVSLQGHDHLGFTLSQRPAPSAGAIHPIHVITHLVGSPCLHRYDPFAHLLRELRCDFDVAMMREAMNLVISGGDGVLLMFVAEPGRTFAKYAEASSLIWRDAGILQGYFSIAAEALDLNFSLLGVTGEPWASRLVQKAGLTGVGVAFVGGRP